MQTTDEYIYVMDYSTGEIYEIILEEDDNLNVEEILKSKGFNIDECNVMITTTRITQIKTI